MTYMIKDKLVYLEIDKNINFRNRLRYKHIHNRSLELINHINTFDCVLKYKIRMCKLN